MALGIVLLIWTLTPIYNMVMVSLEPHGDVFTEHDLAGAPVARELLDRHDPRLLVSRDISGTSSATASISALMTVFLTLLIGSLASFAIGRMRIRHGWLLSNAALLTYVIPSSFLAIPFYRIMQIMG